MPRKHGTSQAVVSYNISELEKTGRPHDQCVAIAMKWQREDASKNRKGKKRRGTQRIQ